MVETSGRYTSLYEWRHEHPEPDFKALSENPHNQAVELLLDNPTLIDWDGFAMNANDRAVDVLLQKLSSCRRPGTLPWLWSVSANPNDRVVSWLEQHSGCRYPDAMAMNANNRIVDILLQHPFSVDWLYLSFNSNDRAVDMLMHYPKEINVPALSRNANDRVVSWVLNEETSHSLSFTSQRRLLGRYREEEGPLRFPSLQCHQRVDWKMLSANGNPRAVAWLEQHAQHIHSQDIWCNPRLFDEPVYCLK